MDNQLEKLLSEVWLLANLVNRGPFESVSDGPSKTPCVRFTPGIADYGQWGCTVEIDYTAEGQGRGLSTHTGTISSARAYVGRELMERLGKGCPRLEL